MIKEWIANNLERNSIILEAGTCNGEDTLFFSNYFNEGFVYGFEPITNLFEETKSKISNNNCFLYNMALSDNIGEKEIYVSDRFGEIFGSSSILKPKKHLDIHKEITFKEKITIKTITLNEVNSIIQKHFEEKIIHKNEIDLIWLDMQGYEKIALENGIELLKKVKYLYTEVSLIETYENVELYPEYKEWLNQIGFEVIFEDLPWEDMGNVLFKNTNL